MLGTTVEGCDFSVDRNGLTEKATFDLEESRGGVWGKSIPAGEMAVQRPHGRVALTSRLVR